MNQIVKRYSTMAPRVLKPNEDPCEMVKDEFVSMDAALNAPLPEGTTFVFIPFGINRCHRFTTTLGWEYDQLAS